jgi:hypothetical protein
MVSAATAAGSFVWSFDPGHLGIANPAFATNGPNLLAYGGGGVAVIDRTGTVIGHGTYTGTSQLSPAPTGLSWAWTTLDSTATPPAPRTSSLWVASVEQAPTRVRTWTGSYTVSARQWSDAGVVAVEIGENCGGEPLGSSLVDRARGTETALFGAERWPLDAEVGLSVAMGADRHSLYVIGRAEFSRTYPLPIQAAAFDSAGARLFASTFGEMGCGGRVATATSVVDVASNSQTTLDGFFADAWLDDQHLLGRTLATGPGGQLQPGSTVRVADLSGQVSDLVPGRLVGVLRGRSS